MDLPAGPVDFSFVFGPTLNVTLGNGGVSDAGAYLVQIGLGTSANVGPGQVAYLGLSDRAYPGSDFDFQDLTLSITATPLPAALPLFASGLGALGLLGWRRKRKVQCSLIKSLIGFRRDRREAVFLFPTAPV